MKKTTHTDVRLGLLLVGACFWLGPASASGLLLLRACFCFGPAFASGLVLVETQDGDEMVPSDPS